MQTLLKPPGRLSSSSRICRKAQQRSAAVASTVVASGRQSTHALHRSAPRQVAPLRVASKDTAPSASSMSSMDKIDSWSMDEVDISNLTFSGKEGRCPIRPQL